MLSVLFKFDAIEFFDAILLYCKTFRLNHSVDGSKKLVKILFTMEDPSICS